MDTQTQAQIYLADQRGCTETADFRSYHNFNSRTYVDESRQPFGALCLLNDDTLRAGASLPMQVLNNTDVLLIPISGGLEYKSDLSTGFLAPGEVLQLSLASGMTYAISNPYETDYINFIQIWLTSTKAKFVPVAIQTSFSLSNKNVLLPLSEITDASTGKPVKTVGYIGLYDGREDGFHQVQGPVGHTPTCGTFIFVVNGAFEVQNRLLHHRDGLALSDIPGGLIEFEALSPNALLIIIDVQMASA